MATNYNPRTVTDGLVLCLDAANPKSYSGSGTTWYDLSSSGFDATLTGCTYEANNQGGIVMDDGNEFISVPTSYDLTSLGTSDFSVEMIVRSDDVVYPRSRCPLRMFHTVTSGTGSTPGWSVGHRSSTNYMEVRCADGSNYDSTTISSSTIAESTFYHRTFTVSRNSGLVTNYFLNAEYQGQANASSVTGSIYNASSDSGPSGISFGYVYGWRYIGSINIIRVYDKVLSNTEIQQNFEATRGRFGV